MTPLPTMLHRAQENYCVKDTIMDHSVHVTLPPHSFSVQVKSGACYITSQWGQV